MEVNYIYKFISGIHKKHNSIGVMEGRFLGTPGGGVGDMWIPFQSKKEFFYSVLSAWWRQESSSRNNNKYQ